MALSVTDGPGRVIDVQLVEDGAVVPLDGRLGRAERAGDFRRGLPRGHPGQDLDFEDR